MVAAPGDTAPSSISGRLTAQLLSGPPAPDAPAAVQRLLAVQAQDRRGFRLAIRARSQCRSAAEVERALDDRALVVTWLNRGTLHLVRADDYGWLHALTTPRLASGNARRLAQEGVDPGMAERAVARVAAALADEGPLRRDELRARLDATGVRTQGQAFVHILSLASLRGLIVRGPDGGDAFALTREWIGDPKPVDGDRALAELARRYLAGHGPASDRDLARWAGLPLRDARAGLAAIATEIVEREPDGLVDLARRDAPAELPPPLLLGAFDPFLLGWEDRKPIVGEDGGVVTSNGIFRPIALVEGRAVATWALSRGHVQLQPFTELTRVQREALEADGEAVVRFLSRAD